MSRTCTNNEGLKKYTSVTMPGKRKTGRPKSRWIDRTEEEIRTLGLNNWKLGGEGSGKTLPPKKKKKIK